jgi:hypothetical protein
MNGKKTRGKEMTHRAEDQQAKLASAIEPHWQTAHAANTDIDWHYRWSTLRDFLCGFTQAMIWYDNDAYSETKGDMDLLKDIATSYLYRGYYHG